VKKEEKKRKEEEPTCHEVEKDKGSKAPKNLRTQRIQQEAPGAGEEAASFPSCRIATGKVTNSRVI